MIEKNFFNKFYDLKDNTLLKVSDIHSILLKFEEKIENYDKQDSFNKTLIKILLNHSIILSTSSIQYFLEELVCLIEKFILENNISINKLNKTIYNLYYEKHSEKIIRDFLVYGEDILTKKLGEFILKNDYGNIKLKNGSSNTVNYANIKKILSLIVVDIDKIIERINIENCDYKEYIDGRIGSKYIISKKNKIKFFQNIINNLNEKRNEIAHGKILINKNIIKDYKLLLLIKKYFFNHLFIELELNLKENIRKNIYFKKS